MGFFPVVEEEFLWRTLYFGELCSVVGGPPPHRLPTSARRRFAEWQERSEARMLGIGVLLGLTTALLPEAERSSTEETLIVVLQCRNRGRTHRKQQQKSSKYLERRAVVAHEYVTTGRKKKNAPCVRTDERGE